MTLFGERPARGGKPEQAKAHDAKPGAGKRTIRDLKVGEVAHIIEFLDENEALKKIEAMGLRRGRKITIMQKLGRGIVVKTSNSRIVLTTDVARDIEVK